MTDEQLKQHPIVTIGEVVSIDKVWFKSNSSDEVLVFELYTDYHRLLTFHFNKQEIPEDLANKIELHTLVNGAYMMIGQNEKKPHLAKFADSAKIIDASYFTTKRGFSLGTQKKLVMESYGAPQTLLSSQPYEIFIWKFDGDKFSAGNNPDKPIAENSFGYEVTAYFKEDKLIALILFNVIP